VQQNMPGVLPLRGRHPRRPMRDLRAAAVLRLGLLVLATAIAFIDGLHWTAVTGAVTVPAMVRPAVGDSPSLVMHPQAGSAAAVASCRFGAIAAKRMFTLSSRPEDEARRVTRVVGSLGATGAGVAGVTISELWSRPSRAQSSLSRAPPAPAMCQRPFGTLALARIDQRPQPTDDGTGAGTGSGSLCGHAAARGPCGQPRRSAQRPQLLSSCRLPDGDGDTEPELATEDHLNKDGGNSHNDDSRGPGLLAWASSCWAPTRATPAATVAALHQKLAPISTISLACADLRWGLTSLLAAGPGLGDSTALDAVEVCTRSRPGWDRVGPVGFSGAQGCLSVERRAPSHRLGMALPHQASPVCGRLMAFLEVGLLSRCCVRWWVDEGEGAVTCRRATAVNCISRLVASRHVLSSPRACCSPPPPTQPTPRMCVVATS
jgi:hypothetical protein